MRSIPASRNRHRATVVAAVGASLAVALTACASQTEPSPTWTYPESETFMVGTQPQLCGVKVTLLAEPAGSVTFGLGFQDTVSAKIGDTVQLTTDCAVTPVAVADTERTATDGGEVGGSVRVAIRERRDHPLATASPFPSGTVPNGVLTVTPGTATNLCGQQVTAALQDAELTLTAAGAPLGDGPITEGGTILAGPTCEVEFLGIGYGQAPQAGRTVFLTVSQP